MSTFRHIHEVRIGEGPPAMGRVPGSGGATTAPSGGAYRDATNGKECFRRNICTIRPTHRPACYEELAEFSAISKRLKYWPLEPMREVNSLSKAGVEDELDLVTRDVPGFDDLRQNGHVFYSSGAIWPRG